MLDLITKPLNLLLLVGLFILQYALWAGDKSLPDYHRLKQEITASTAENSTLASRNRDLAAEIVSLKSDLNALEDLARRELGMIKPGETFFQVIE